jgi:flagellar hook-length control protein FliK
VKTINLKSLPLIQQLGQTAPKGHKTALAGSGSIAPISSFAEVMRAHEPLGVGIAVNSRVASLLKSADKPVGSSLIISSIPRLPVESRRLPHAPESSPVLRVEGKDSLVHNSPDIGNPRYARQIEVTLRSAQGITGRQMTSASPAYPNFRPEPMLNSRDGASNIAIPRRFETDTHQPAEAITIPADLKEMIADKYTNSNPQSVQNPVPEYIQTPRVEAEPPPRSLPVTPGNHQMQELPSPETSSPARLTDLLTHEDQLHSKSIESGVKPESNRVEIPLPSIQQVSANTVAAERSETAAVPVREFGAMPVEVSVQAKSESTLFSPAATNSSAPLISPKIDHDFQVTTPRPHQALQKTDDFTETHPAETGEPSQIDSIPLENKSGAVENSVASSSPAQNNIFADGLDSAMQPSAPKSLSDAASQFEAPQITQGDAAPTNSASQPSEGAAAAANRSGAGSVKLETPAGGSSGLQGRTGFVSGKIGIRGSNGARLRARMGSARTTPSQATNAVKATNPTSEPEPIETPQVDDQPRPSGKEPQVAGRSSHPDAPAPGQIKLQHIQNLRELADKIQARAQMLHTDREALLVKLNPPHLGLLRIQVETEGHQMSLAISADKPEAVKALNEARAELIQVVNEQGYTLTRCEVDSQPHSDRRAEGYMADQPKRQPTPTHTSPSNDNQGQQTEDFIPGQHQPLDLGYNTLDLVA